MRTMHLLRWIAKGGQRDPRLWISLRMWRATSNRITLDELERTPTLPQLVSIAEEDKSEHFLVRHQVWSRQSPGSLEKVSAC